MVGTTEIKTIVIGNGKKSYHEYNNYNLIICNNTSDYLSNQIDFQPYLSGTLEEVITRRGIGTFMAGYYNNDYLTERINRLIIKRMTFILKKSIKLKEEDENFFEKVYKLGRKYYSMWNKYNEFNKKINFYYNIYNTFPKNYTLEGRKKW